MLASGLSLLLFEVIVGVLWLFTRVHLQARVKAQRCGVSAGQLGEVSMRNAEQKQSWAVELPV
jgi:hypothetical protein